MRQACLPDQLIMAISVRVGIRHFADLLIQQPLRLTEIARDPEQSMPGLSPARVTGQRLQKAGYCVVSGQTGADPPTAAHLVRAPC